MHEILVPSEVISSGCNALVVPFQQLMQGPMEVLLCERINDLNLKIQISPTGKIYTFLFWKSATKNLFVHLKLALPLTTKINYIRNEIKLIHIRYREGKVKITHTTHFINILTNIDYPSSITQHLNNKKSWKLHTRSYTYFLNLLYFSEIISKEIRWAINKGGLDIQLAYSGPSL